MDIKPVITYLNHKSNRIQLEKEVSKLRKELTALESQLSQSQAAESESLTLIDPDSLITRESVKVINTILSQTTGLRWKDGAVFPLSLALLSWAKNGDLRLKAIFSQPLFNGWKTETPYYSYQSCPLSVNTPESPSSNHVPQYLHMVDQVVELSCWEVKDEEVLLWLWWKDGEYAVSFVLGGK